MSRRSPAQMRRSERFAQRTKTDRKFDRIVSFGEPALVIPVRVYRQQVEAVAS